MGHYLHECRETMNRDGVTVSRSFPWQTIGSIVSIVELIKQFVAR